MQTGGDEQRFHLPRKFENFRTNSVNFPKVPKSLWSLPAKALGHLFKWWEWAYKHVSRLMFLKILPGKSKVPDKDKKTKTTKLEVNKQQLPRIMQTVSNFYPELVEDVKDYKGYRWKTLGRKEETRLLVSYSALFYFILFGVFFACLFYPILVWGESNIMSTWKMRRLTTSSYGGPRNNIYHLNTFSLIR